MTIAAAYLVSEGVVLGADSATTVIVEAAQRRNVAQLLTHSQKVFEVGQNSRLGVCTWGAGSLGKASHRTIVARLGDKVDDKTKVADAAKLLGDMAEALFEEAPESGFVGYYLGGWDAGSHEPACFIIEVDQNGRRIKPFELGLCSFSGMPRFFTRVFRGYDPQLRDNLLAELKGRLTQRGETDEFDEIFREAFESATGRLVAAGFRDLPIREAIDYVYSHLHITVKAQKFTYGPPTCGGPIEVGFVSTDRRFRWVCHKAFSSAILEQEGIYDDR